MIAATARYIGFLTYRYSPPTTRRSLGATGAGVPRPSPTKRANACTSTRTPAAMRIRPPIHSGTQYGKGPRASQPVSNHGTRPATTPGANTRNTRLPMAALAFGTSFTLVRVLTAGSGLTQPPAYARPASASGRRPQAKRVSYQPVIGVRVVPRSDECTIQPDPT